MLSGEKAAPINKEQCGNSLLDRLPQRQHEEILDQCDSVDLLFGSVLCEAGQPFEYAYFPISGSISLVKFTDGHEPFQTQNIGREGMLSAAFVLDTNQASQRGIVQTPCHALRMSTEQIRRVLDKHSVLQRILQRYLSVVLAELAQSAACVRYHDVESRMARDLLRYHDRVEAGDLPLLTHKLLAEMLGVRRSSVTLAAGRLQSAGIIRYSRGRVAILDRKGLEAAACGCYQASIENYQSFLAPHSVESK